MVRITLPPDIESQLAGLMKPAELYGSDGRLLGRFVPDGPLFLPIEEARKLGMCPFTDEELAQSALEPREGRRLEEILRDLESNEL